MPNTTKEQDFAGKMKRLRTKGKVSIEALAAATGFSADYLDRVEKREVMPPVSAIIQISKALVVDAGKFLSADDTKTGRKKAESFSKRKNAYFYKTLTPDAEHKHMKGFHVTIPPESDHEGVEYKHEGEEFIYVLDGRLEIKVGADLRSLKKGETIHFDANKTHRLRNPGKKKTELIVVVYTP